MGSKVGNVDHMLLPYVLEASEVNRNRSGLELSNVYATVQEYLDRDRQPYRVSELPTHIRQAIEVAQQHKIVGVVNGVLYTIAGRSRSL